ncbi:MAG: hypothetical protein GY928_08485 [Colwellia sp.]|nr:hypothetical protein [Colwellia sp.]
MKTKTTSKLGAPPKKNDRGFVPHIGRPKNSEVGKFYLRRRQFRLTIVHTMMLINLAKCGTWGNNRSKVLRFVLEKFYNEQANKGLVPSMESVLKEAHAKEFPDDAN